MNLNMLCHVIIFIPGYYRNLKQSNNINIYANNLIINLTFFKSIL